MIWERVEIAVREGQEAAFEAALCRQLGVDHFFERPGLALNGPGVITDLSWLTE